MGRDIAILGGTFNPIHYGHLRIAEEVRELGGFHKVLFVPANIPPHKHTKGLAPADERLKMVELAIADNEGFALSDIEVRRGGVSYTIDTVEEFLKEGYSVSIVTGTDQFKEIASWYRYEALFRLADFVVVRRAGYETTTIEECLQVELAEKFWYDSSVDAYMNSFGHRVVFLDTTLLAISSSDIRRRIAKGLSVRYLLPPVVEEYIRKRGLYRDL